MPNRYLVVQRLPAEPFVSGQVAQPVTAQFDVETLAAETEHLSSRSTIVLSELKCGFDAQTLNNVGRLAHQIFQWNPTDEFGQLLHCARLWPLAADELRVARTESATHVANRESESAVTP